jgi:hypothetical protein
MGLLPPLGGRVGAAGSGAEGEGLTRRGAIGRAARLAGAGWLALGLPPAWAARPSDPPAPPAAREPIRSCIFLFYYGGPSHLDTFDPKPDAPREIRGEYATIPTPVPGVRLGEHLPMTARVMDRLALVRSLHHPMSNHNSAAAETLTGRQPAGGDLELLSDGAQAPPTLGSAVAYGLGSRAGILPYVALPHTMYNVVQLPGQTAGFLGSAHERFQVQSDPSSPRFRIESLALHGGEGGEALRRRAVLLRSLDKRPLGGAAAELVEFRERALRVLSSDSVRRGFDLSGEAERVRERYGRNILGQSLLLARRLVEEGVRFVSVFDGAVNGQDANWDSHQNLFPRHRELLGRSDRAFSALIEDLEARGLLESTLVVAVGEFGRTPRVNGSAGRDHWPDCYTGVLAGGGARGGAVFGSSDRSGAFPSRDPVTPGDLAATILWRFGIDPATEVRDQLSRPYRLSEGNPLEAIFS